MKTSKALDHGTQKGVAYLRCNLGNTEPQQILDAQLERIKQCAAQDDIEIVRVYSDIQSGFNGSENIDLVLSDAKAGKFSMLYFDRLDRLSRDISKSINIIRSLDESGVEMRSVSKKLDGVVPKGKLMLRLIVSLNGFHEDDI